MLRSDQASGVVVLGCGFVGSAVATHATRRLPVTVLSRSIGDVPASVVPVEGPVSPESVAAALRPGCTVVYAVGATVPGSGVSEEEAAAVELEPLRVALEVAADKRVSRFLYVSSGGTVYGDSATTPTPEDAPLQPQSVYGRIRVAAERAVAESGLQSTSLRLGNVYGPTQPTAGTQGILGAAIRAAEQGTPLHLFGEGAPIRDFVHVDDVAHAVSSLIGWEADLPEAVNVGSGTGTSIRSALDIVEQMMGRTIEVIAEPARPFDVAVSVLDITLLESLVPTYSPRPLAEGLATCISSSSVQQCE